MKNFYRKTERIFENFSEIVIKVFGNSITFIIAVILVIVYLISAKTYNHNFHRMVYDIILCVTFLGFFIIQKSFNKYSTALHLKMNELVAAHDKASNRMVNIEKKTEEELRELEKHYSDLAEDAINSDDIHATQSIEIILEAQKQKDEAAKD